MTDQSDALSIAEFEHVAAGPSMTLLRVAGRVSPEGAQPELRPALLAEHPGGLERFDALPSPPDPPGVMRAAYSVPAILVTPETSFRLELASGSLVELPASAPGAARRPGAAAAGEPSPAAVQALPADPRTEPEEQARQLAAENERLSSTLAELEIWRGELERRLTETTDQLADARARLVTAELEALSMRAEAEALARAARELAEATGTSRP